MKPINTRFFTLFIIPIIALLLYSCEKDADIKLPDIKSQLVVTSFISPEDTLITVNITETKPLYKPYNNYNININSATVSISDGVNSMIIPYSNYRYNINSSLFPILAGHSYFLSVSTPDGRMVKAQTTVPSMPTPVIATSYYETRDNGDGTPTNGMYTKLQLKLNDPAGIKNYYRTDIKGFVVNPYMISLDTTVLYSNYMSSLKYQFDTDDGQDGETITLDKSIDNAFSTDSTLKFFEITLLNCNYPYYAYHKSLTNALNSGTNNFFVEPSIMYSNIDGGLGVFGAYISTKRRVYK